MSIPLEREAARDSAADLLAAGDNAFKRGDFAEAASLYEQGAPLELPPADLCLKIARSHDKAGDPDGAYRWLARLVEGSDEFVAWNAAASLLARLSKTARPAARRTCRVGLTGSYTTSQFTAMLPLAALRHGVDLSVEEGLF